MFSAFILIFICILFKYTLHRFCISSLDVPLFLQVDGKQSNVVDNSGQTLVLTVSSSWPLKCYYYQMILNLALDPLTSLTTRPRYPAYPHATLSLAKDNLMLRKLFNTGRNIDIDLRNLTISTLRKLKQNYTQGLIDKLHKCTANSRD